VCDLTPFRGENEGKSEEDSSGGGLIGHCVSPQPWREIDAHASYTCQLTNDT